MGLQNLPESQGIRLLRQLFLDGKRIFNMQDVKDAAVSEKVPHNQLNKILSNLTRHGRVIRLRRGLYIIVEELSAQNNIHPFVIATHLVQPSVISHWSALQYHGLTEQIPQIITASTPAKVVTPSMREKEASRLHVKHQWQVDGVYYEYIHLSPKQLFGIEKIWLDENFQVPITDKERTLLDVFASPKIFGGLGEAFGILESTLANLNIRKLIDYAIQYNKKSLAKRLGWALEYFGVSAKQLEALRKVPIQYYCRLDPQAPAIGPCDKRWMIQNNLQHEQKK